MKNDHLDNQNKLPARVDKTLAWLTDSRDTWKEKCKETKLQLKRQTFAVKRLKNLRDDWKLSSIELKQELIESKKKISCLQQRIDELESQSHKKEAHVLKKKQ